MTVLYRYDIQEARRSHRAHSAPIAQSSAQAGPRVPRCRGGDSWVIAESTSTLREGGMSMHPGRVTWSIYLSLRKGGQAHAVAVRAGKPDRGGGASGSAR